MNRFANGLAVDCFDLANPFGLSNSLERLNPAVQGVIYPCGASFEDDLWTLSYGINGEHCAIAVLLHRQQPRCHASTFSRGGMASAKRGVAPGICLGCECLARNRGTRFQIDSVPWFLGQHSGGLAWDLPGRIPEER
jgi:hypothetical protein